MVDINMVKVVLVFDKACSWQKFVGECCSRY